METAVLSRAGERMSDFLNNLVARTLNLAPVVQPRLTSLFEPVGPVAATAPSEESVEVEGTSETVARVDQRVPLEAQLMPHRDHSREDVRHVTVEHERVQSREVLQPRIEQFQNTLLVPPPQNFTHEIEHLPTSEPLSRPTPRLNTEQVSQRSELDKTTQVPIAAESESWRQLQPRVRSLIESRLSAVQPAPVNDRVLSPTPATTPQPNVSRSIVRNEVAPVASTSRAEPSFGFQPEPTETINVTIGRVDVRAVFSPQATAPPARPRTSNVNSLDDYLKQRSEGRR